MSKGTILSEKPYAFVPLLEKKESEKYIGHNKIHPDRYSGKLFLKMETLSPVHVSQGKYRFEDNKNDFTVMTAELNNRVYIPGSGIKGAIRSITESVSYSCAPQPPKRFLNQALPSSNRFVCQKQDACVSCRLFGFSSRDVSYKGQIIFEDFSPIEEVKLETRLLPQLQSPFKKDYPKNRLRPFPENGYGNERLYYCQVCNDFDKCNTCTKEEYLEKLKLLNNNSRNYRFRGRKFYYHSKETEERKNGIPHEFIPAGTTLVGSVIINNLSYEELSLLAFSFGLDKAITPKIGYGKPAYFGSVRFSFEKYEDIKSRYGLKKEELDFTTLAKEYREKAPKDIKTNINILSNILNWDNPAGNPWPIRDGNKTY
ncbi:hypothetical protein SYNTR_1195 [Candidatus Syntrophocurvum alkaliphilum]|uniref:CRISPR type III-associated protein domain-containing protein n=1 Tax=Candidatus Syntrophocurvum alkaliphilum TaxID=2293317 RepID=A0A6I6DAE4_9FIRM|nr:RAMP superfamily CRISPR-associated protein [Candidatus Syntrophocurvum alkaliphilum]QGT99788.1 hypothetical protein SYNTR_1195 [Candidatus Syntrophocurvum alkaliphilum]